MSTSTKNKHNNVLMFILTLGVFEILNTEMGVVGIIPIIAETFGVTVPDAGWTVSLFALIIAFSAPVVPLLFSRINRKTVMVLALSVFVISNFVSIFTTNFTVLLITRAIPAFFHPLYVSIAFSTAASSVSRENAPKAVSKIFAGVSAGMVLGVPVTSYIASEFSFSAAMVFFTIVNAIVLLATVFLLPTMPVKERLSYGTQLSVLKKPVLWNSFIAALLMNAAMFGFYSYLSDYLITITDVSFKVISILLFVYGIANIVGNIAAGKLLAQRPSATLKYAPAIMAILYLALYWLGESTVPTAVVILILGIFAGIANNGNQFMVSTSATEAPDFANGLFLTAANLGTTLGTAVCGMFITAWGTHSSPLGAVAFLIAGVISIVIRNSLTNHGKHITRTI
ncbi:MFS transporter [Butyricimonas hominis]|uniref:MFS transporter n=1 Tax=Butyricimonas TaxID=574697 RepID=UPI003519A1F1